MSPCNPEFCNAAPLSFTDMSFWQRKQGAALQCQSCLCHAIQVWSAAEIHVQAPGHKILVAQQGRVMRTVMPDSFSYVLKRFW